MVDWRRGAAEPLYGVAHQNTRVVGREIGLLARFLNLETGMFFKDVHLIGLSLGAHAAGYAGENQPGFGRISGEKPSLALATMKNQIRDYIHHFLDNSKKKICNRQSHISSCKNHMRIQDK